jgi:hypothetical protein
VNQNESEVKREATARPWVVANGREIHDRITRFDESGARIGETANRIALIEYPYGDGEGRNANAELIVRAVNAHDGLVAACQATLMFHSALVWDDDACKRWLALTGSPEATTRPLCDFVRAALSAAKGASAS